MKKPDLYILINGYKIVPKARYVLVAEAARADGSLVKARKGMARYKIEFSGIAAHAGNEPEKVAVLSRKWLIGF